MICKECQVDYPLERFYEHKPGARRKTCVFCTLDKNQKYREAIARGESRTRAPAPDRSTYIAAWRAKLMEEARIHLGGRCEGCGDEGELQFDHYDPTTKVAEVATVLTRQGLDAFWIEVEKCQLLCVDCHKAKTRSEREPAHGSERRYAKPWVCRCEPCMEGASARNRAASERRATRAGREYKPRGKPPVGPA
jgi:hypothetical protein